MSKNFFPIAELIKAGIEKAGLKGAVREKAAIKLWPEVVGEKTASVTKVEKVMEGIMYINCRDSMWAQQLHFLRPVIIEKLNEKLGGKIIREIRIAGRGYSRERSSEEVDKDQEKNYIKPELGKEEIKIINKAVESIDDPGLAEKVRKGLQAARALRKSYEEGKKQTSL